MKLEIKHLSAYLPYGLKVKWGADTANLVGLVRDAVILNGEFWMSSQKTSIDNIKPILRNLSDLTKEIEVNGEKFVPMIELAKIANLDTTKYSLGDYNGDTYGILCDIRNNDDYDTHEVLGFDLISGFGHHYKPSKNFTIVNNQLELWNKLFEWHFDIFNLIPNNLAIDINSLNK